MGCMAQFASRRRTGPRILPEEVLDRFKYEVAQDLGLLEDIRRRGWPEMTSRDCGRVGGKIGGRMVRVMIRYAEQALASDGDL
ncbi:MAG: alpha/beta-type small acid-soluble spore protein [Acetobacteraceae bacterium]|nr:alpha/beta-type small acid-soluble spore protein [Acetobacteraceae bacterium]